MLEVQFGHIPPNDALEWISQRMDWVKAWVPISKEEHTFVLKELRKLRTEYGILSITIRDENGGKKKEALPEYIKAAYERAKLLKEKRAVSMVQKITGDLARAPAPPKGKGKAPGKGKSG